MLGSKGPRQAPAFLKAPALDTDRTGQHAPEARQRGTRGSNALLYNSSSVAVAQTGRGLNFMLYLKVRIGKSAVFSVRIKTAERGKINGNSKYQNRG